MLNGGGVLDAIRRDIVAGALQPGTRVTEAFLSERYGVSRVPVREALRGLEGEGFVVSRPNAGSRIAEIPFDEADDLFAVRESLEVATARRAATRARTLFDGDAPPEDWWRVRRELGAVLDAGDAAVERGELDVLVEHNERFHFLVAELSGSTTLATLLVQLSRKIEWLYALDTVVARQATVAGPPADPGGDRRRRRRAGSGAHGVARPREPHRLRRQVVVRPSRPAAVGRPGGLTRAQRNCRTVSGSTRFPFTRVSTCTWGPVDWPVLPDFAISCSARTV